MRIANISRGKIESKPCWGKTKVENTLRTEKIEYQTRIKLQPEKSWFTVSGVVWINDEDKI